MKPRPSPLVLPSLLVCLLGAAPAAPEVLERVVVKVNGSILTLSEFETRQIAALQAARVRGDQIEAFLRENNARILQEAVDDLLLVERATALGIKVPPEYLNEVVEGIKKDNNLPSDEALQEQLRREGMTFDDLKRNVSRSLLKRHVLSQELKSRTDVTEADALAHYESHLAEYTHPATVHLQEIVVSGDGARARAQELVSRARAGEEFTALARSHSSAPTRAAGGDLGAVALQDISAELASVTAGLPPGSISEPLPVGDGFRILRVVARTDAQVTPFERVKDELVQRLTRERWDREYRAYVDGLRKDALIDVRVREVPLQVDVPAAPSTLLEPPVDPVKPAAPPAAGADDEFTVSPQDKPERVAPVGPGGPLDPTRPPEDPAKPQPPPQR